MQGKLISLVGTPASGKTFLVNKLCNFFKFTPIYEKPKKGFPQEIINNLKTQSNFFQTILWFRNRQIQNYKKALNLCNKGINVVLDTPFYQNQLYIDLYIPDNFEREILYKMGQLDIENYCFPDCTIFIKATCEDIQNFLLKRKGRREWETKIFCNFIKKIAPLANKYMFSIANDIPNLITIKRGEFDFEKEEEFLRLVRKIEDLLKI